MRTEFRSCAISGANNRSILIFRIDARLVQRSRPAALAILLIGFLALHADIARGQPTSAWNVSSGSWNVAGNWSPSGVPSNATVDIINNDAVHAISTTTFPTAAAPLSTR